MSLFNNHSSGLAGFMMAGIVNRRTRKALMSVQRENEANQGVLRYEPSDIEAFFDENNPIENMMFTGGDNSIRVRAITRAIECAYIQGYSVLLLHGGNRELENSATNYFGIGNVCVVNGSNPIYDPFIGASNSEIARLIVSSSTKDYKINATGRYYINGISDYIRANKKSPRCYMYINCPHLTFIDGVNKAESQGRISQNEARSIISQIMQGEIERGNIEAFFQALSRQGASILAQKSNAGNAVNYVDVSHKQQILSVDVQSSTNTVLINTLVNEAETIISQGGKTMIVADGIQICTSDVLMDYIKRGGGYYSVVASSDDVYSGFGGNDNEFFAFSGKCSKIIISKHSSAHSCQKYSDIIGSYDKHEINNSYAQNANYVGHWGYGTTHTASINTKRENRVKPEEIQGMAVDEVFIMDKITGEISYVPIL